MKIQPVRNEAQYQRAKARVAELLPRSDAASHDEAEILGILVEQYERSRFLIAMTLRHDRIDNFWFTLLHELCHALRHIGDETNLILDDLELKGSDQIEAEADAFAQSALIPPEIWEAEVTPDLENEGIEQIARLAGVHPAIVAGRWQRDHNDFRRFAKLLGH